MHSKGNQEKGLGWGLPGWVNLLFLDAPLPYRTPPDRSKPILKQLNIFIADLSQEI